MSSRAPTVVLVDDVAEVRSLVRTRLRLSGDFTVVGEGCDGSDAIELATEHHPALLLLDVSMPGMDGMEALPRVLEASPTTRVVMYSGFEQAGIAEQAVRLGASAFVEKSAPAATLARVLAEVLCTSPSDPEQEQGQGHEQGQASVHSPATESRPGMGNPVLDAHLERFREVFSEAAIGMATVTLTGRVVRANRALGDLFHRPAVDLVGMLYRDLAPQQVSAVDTVLHDMQLRGLDVAQVEHGLPGTGDGRALATFAPVRDPHGRPLYLFLQVQDVTAQRAAEEALRSSDEWARLLVATVEDYAIFMLDPDGVVATWNAGAQRSKGYRAEEIVGRHFRVFYPAHQQAKGHPEHELALTRLHGHYEEEGWRVRKDGSQFWANVVITALYDDAGKHVGFAKVTRDVTDRREADEALRLSEQRFRLLVEAVRDYAIFMLDPSGCVVSWNAGAQRSKGYTAEEILGQHVRVFYPPDLQEARHPEHELAEALREGRYREEGVRVRKDGSRFWADVVITAVFHEGVHVGFAKVTRDVTERRVASEQREAAAAALASANVALESLNGQLRQAADDQAQMVAVTAHELRTPVGVLSGSAETLAAHLPEMTPDELTRILGGMTASADRLRRLLGDLLTASRLQLGPPDLTTGRISVGDIVGAAVASLRTAGSLGEIVVDVPAGLQVLADPDRIGQVFDNVLANALRHGCPPVLVGARTRDGHVEVRVCDQGSGVPAGTVPRLFQRFSSGPRNQGTGLGLFIARELARAQAGEVVYEAGTAACPAGSFVISLPVVVFADVSTSAAGSAP